MNVGKPINWEMEEKKIKIIYPNAVVFVVAS